MSEKVHHEQIEETTARRPGFGQKVKRHCARFWWIHLIVFCLIVLIIALCLVYVGMPRIAQHDVDASYLEFTELQFLDPTPNSVVLTQRSTLYNPSRYTPTLDAFNASFYLATAGVVAAEKITEIELPEIHATKPSSNVFIDRQTLNFETLDQITDFATQVLKNEEVETVLKGKTNLHLGALPTVDVDYYEATTYKGLNGLKGFNVTRVLVNPLAEPGEPNLSGMAFIPNPSVMTIAMGNVTLTISTATAGVVGNSTILNMTLKPGNNSLPMTGIVDQPKLIGSMVNGRVELLITGKDAVYNGEHLVYYERALASNNLTLSLNVQQVLVDSAAAAGGGNDK